MAFKPLLILYDEPTTGLDPITATSIADEIVKLRDLEHATSIIVTHQLRDAFYIATHEAVEEGDGGVAIVPARATKIADTEFVMLREGRIVFEGDVNALRAANDEYIVKFLS